VDDSGVEEIDLPIKDRIEDISRLDADLVVPNTFAIADDTRLRYTLYHPLGPTSTVADHAWIYNADQGTWTERTDAASGGMVHSDNGLLYLGSTTSRVLTQERTGDAEDIYKGPDGDPIPVRLVWAVQAEGDPSTPKQYTELRLLTRDAITGSATFTCTNDLGGSQSTVGYATSSTTGEPYIEAWVPDGCQRTSRLLVDIQRSVLEEAFEVVGMRYVVAGMYRGNLSR
jgi:hypothetical protein